MEAPVDPERVAQARNGDAAAFEAFVEARVGSMMRTAMAILGREDEARDAVQDTLVTAWRELASLRDPAAFDAWLTRILVNRCRRGLRTVGLARLREIPADEVAELDVPRTADIAGAVVDRRRPRARLRPAVHRRANDPRPPPPRRTTAGVDRGGAEDPRGHREVAAVQGASLAGAGDGTRGGTMTGPLPDDQLRAMLEERAARVSPDTEREAMAAFRAAVRGTPDGTGGFAVIPQALSSRDARLPWGLAVLGLIVVVAIALLGGRLSSTNDAGASAPAATGSGVPSSIPASTGTLTGDQLRVALADGSLARQVIVVDGDVGWRQVACADPANCTVPVPAGLDDVPMAIDPAIGNQTSSAQPPGPYVYVADGAVLTYEGTAADGLGLRCSCPISSPRARRSLVATCASSTAG